jgi:putative addiction module component (TIGR02574 family)
MAAPLEDILEEALALPDDSKLMLAERLVESVSTEAGPDIEARQLDEVQRRLLEVEAGRVQLVPGEDALRQVRRAVEKPE